MKAIAIIAALGIAGGALYLLLGADDDSSDSTEQVDAKTPGGKRGRAGRGGRTGSDRGTSRQDNGARHDGPLEARVERLENEVASLRRALAIRGKVAIAGRGSDDDSMVSAEDPVLEDAVRDIYEEEREREREEQRERRRERFEEFRTAALDDLVQLASLDPQQRESIETLWTSEADRMLPLIEAMRSGDRSFTEVRQEMRQVRQETDDAAKAVLSDSQYESYLESRPRGPGGPRGGRRPSGPPPPPPG